MGQTFWGVSMKIMQAIVLSLSLPWVVTGCASSGYLTDRRRDLTDVVHLDGTALSGGLAVNLGPAIIGAHDIGLPIGDGSGERLKLGLGGAEEISSKGPCWGVGIPFGRYREERRSTVGNHECAAPAWGSLGFDLGFLYGVGVRGDVVELLDFFLGWANIDLLRDDEESWRRFLIGVLVPLRGPVAKLSAQHKELSKNGAPPDVLSAACSAFWETFLPGHSGDVRHFVDRLPGLLGKKLAGSSPLSVARGVCGAAAV